MGENSIKRKKKLEHWEVVTLLLVVYDFFRYLYPISLHYGYDLTADLVQ